MRGKGAKLRMAALAVLVASAGAVPGLSQQTSSEPRESGIREQTQRRLAQLDVSVSGSAEAIANLTPQDFELKVATRVITDFTVDQICQTPSTLQVADQKETQTESATPPAPTVPPGVGRVSYLFYFDQVFLTMAGRNQGLEMAAELIDQLIRDGNRATIVSSGQVLTTYADLTTNVEELKEALNQIAKDPKQWDPTTTSEERKMEQVLEAQQRGTNDAMALARLFQREERWRSDKALRRFSMALGRLADLDPPKAVVYFADRMRSRPGEHYLSYFSNKMQRNNSSLRYIANDAAQGTMSFDRVVNEANAYGARLYTIQAEGMAALGTSVATNQASRQSSGTRHITDAQNSLVSMARETGGEAFLRGVKATKIAKQIQADLSCIYLISFDPVGFPMDQPLPVNLKAVKKGVTARSRGQILLQSDSKRLTSRLMAAFTAPEAGQTQGDLKGSVVPIGFEDGKYTAMVQLAVAGSPLSGVTWDLGASVLSRGEVRADASAQVTVSGPHTPVVFEKVMKFAPGDFEVVLVANESTSDSILTGRVEGTWPSFDEVPIAVAPIAVLQPAAAVFLRDGQTKSSGALGQTDTAPVAADRPTALVSLVCKEKGKKAQEVTVHRQLVGASSVDFPPLELKLGDERCAYVRDLIKAGTMTDGSFTYEVRVLQKDVEIASGTRVFSAAGNAAASPASNPGS